MKLPEFLHKHFLYPFWATKDGNYSRRYLSDFSSSQFLSSDAIAELQFKKAKKLLDYAYKHTSFYKKHWDAAGFHPKQFKSLSDFNLIPTVSKADIQKNREDMVSNQFSSEDLIRNQTGGSTGEPVVFYLDKDRKKSRAASTIRHDRWAGKDYSTKHACIWGHPGEASSRTGKLWSKFRDRIVSRAIFLDTSNISPEIMRDYVDLLLKEKPKVYLAYANSVFLLAQFIRDQGIKTYHKPDSIITSAEVLTPEMRQLIESVFECKVFNRYGCREVSVIASECDQHEGMHVNAEAIYLEVLNNGQPVSPGEIGEIVITDLMNKGMPLIRYEIKDLAIPMEGDCECGRGLPRIQMAGGRVTDFIVTPEGKSVSGVYLATYLVAHSTGVSQAQLVQDSKDALLIKVAKNDDYNESTDARLIAEAKKHLGENMSISVSVQNEPFAVTASGKHRFSISSVSPF